ncbi:MAG: hypothetical protein AB1756_09840 [Acidobacteriota bacterium]
MRGQNPSRASGRTGRPYRKGTQMQRRHAASTGIDGRVDGQGCRAACATAKAATVKERREKTSPYPSACQRRYVRKEEVLTREIQGAGGTRTTYGSFYKGETRKGVEAFLEVGGAHKPEDDRDSKTLSEGRSPASVGVYSCEEGLVTAKGESPLAQRTHRKVQVLKDRLHTAAKKDTKRTFGILYDKVCQWEVLWTAWIRVQSSY